MAVTSGNMLSHVLPEAYRGAARLVEAAGLPDGNGISSNRMGRLQSKTHSGQLR